MGILILFIVIIAVATIDVKTRGIEKARPKKKHYNINSSRAHMIYHAIHNGK